MVRAELGPIAAQVDQRLRRLRDDDVVARILRRDHTVWKPDPTEIIDRLGWLDVVPAMRAHLEDLRGFAKEAAVDGFTRAVLCGMGGSSLAPEVMRYTLGVADGMLDLVVLDSTHPRTVERVAAALDLDRTLFLIASKSGSTIETRSHLAYFWDRTQQKADRFVAITDAGSPLEQLAGDRRFRAVFTNPPDIGGRYSALSLFGLVPAALLGADLDRLLATAGAMADACARSDGPGAWLGAVIGEAALAGRDKLTLLFEPALQHLGDWIEQLVAESTGKEGTGILPVVGEQLGPPEAYGDDRVFVATGDVDGLDALEGAGHPVVRIEATADDLGAEFYRWEFATAIAGHVLGIHPFDQPNVAEAKAATAEILQGGDQGEQLDGAGLASVLATIKPGDHVALLAYLDRVPEAEARLARARSRLRDRHRVATTIGFGPRYLHSTGQLHKGGPNTGVFIQIVEPGYGREVEIPGEAFTFGGLIDAQARGDLRSLSARGRRVARTTLDALGVELG